jgi:hypothetical protein
MHVKIFLGDGVRSQDDFDVVAFFEEVIKGFNIWTGRIAYQQASGQVNHLCTIFDHFLACVLNIPTGAAITGGIPNQLHVRIGVNAERTFPVPQCPQAFPAGARPVSVTNDDPDFGFRIHFLSYFAGTIIV